MKFKCPSDMLNRKNVKIRCLMRQASFWLWPARHEIFLQRAIGGSAYFYPCMKNRGWVWVIECIKVGNDVKFVKSTLVEKWVKLVKTWYCYIFPWKNYCCLTKSGKFLSALYSTKGNPVTKISNVYLSEKLSYFTTERITVPWIVCPILLLYHLFWI